MAVFGVGRERQKGFITRPGVAGLLDEFGRLGRGLNHGDTAARRKMKKDEATNDNSMTNKQYEQ